MKDKIRTPQDLGLAVRTIRKDRKLKAVELARHSGRSRDILHRLEGGRDVSMSALLDILRAMGLALQIVPAGLPTLAEMQQRFAQDDDDDELA